MADELDASITPEVAAKLDELAEAMDRCYMVEVMLEQALRGHPAIEAHAELGEMLNTAGTAIAELYQAISRAACGGPIDIQAVVSRAMVESW